MSRAVDRDEQEAAEDALILMPRVVRDKLDRVGIKLHLDEWQSLPVGRREYLRDARCESASERERYRAELTEMVRSHCGKDPDPLPER